MPNSQIISPSDPRKKHSNAGLRNIYAASVIGLAAFIIGLVLWPGVPSQRNTIAFVHVDTKAHGPIAPDKMKSTMARLRSSCCDETRIAAILESIAGSDELVDASQVASINERLQIRLVPAQAYSKVVWRIEVRLNGRGTQLESQLVDRLASDLALAWQRELIEFSQQDQFQVVQKRFADERVLSEKLAERMERTSAAQWEAVETALAKIDSSTVGLAGIESNAQPEHSPDGSIQNSSPDLPITEFNGPRIDLQDFRPIREPEDHNDPAARAGLVENPQWLMLTNEKARLEWLIEKLQRQNHWTSAHPEISSLSNDLQIVSSQLTNVERFAVDPTAESNREDLTTDDGDSRLEQNGYVAEGVANGDEVPAETAGFHPTTSIDPDEMRASLQAPLDQLQRELTVLEKDWSGSLPSIDDPGVARSDETNLSAYLAKPATTQKTTGSYGTVWRIGLIGFLSLGFGIGLTWFIRDRSETSLLTTHEVERELGLPIIGVLGTPHPSSSSSRRFANPTWVLRGSEVLVAAATGLLMFAVFFNPHVAIDLAENPLLTVSDIFGSILRT